jgi:hypothetical protein
MKTLRIGLFFILSQAFLLAPILGQEISQIGRDRYATDQIELSAEVSSDRKIYVNSALGLSGSLVIKAREASQAVFVYRKLLKTTDKSEAVDYARVIEAKLENTPQGARLLLQAPNPAPWSETDNSGVIEGELLLPVNCQLEIDAIYFDLDISGPLRAVENQASFGRINIENVTEIVTLVTSNRDIMARDIAGDISITGSHAEIMIDNMQSQKQAAYIRNENGSIIVENASGAFDIKNDFGRIKVSNMKFNSERSRFIGSYSPINIEIADIVEGNLTIRNTNEDIYLTVPESISADFSLRVDSNGEINTDGFRVRPTLVDSDRLDFVTGNAGARIRVSVRGEGSIKVQGI